ncbi:MAG: hypothetical protein NUV57_03370, partial [archaeon]|nr:hypothetical protein [archaeon]
DTDGCVFFDKRKSYKKPYVRIALQMLNPPLIKQVSNKLEEFDIHHGVTKKGTTIQINGFDSVKDFVDKIGFSNERHAKKIHNAFNN